MPSPDSQQSVYRLENKVQHYDWGSYTSIAELLGREPSGKPEAELWMGAHPSAPSLALPYPSSCGSPLSSSCASALSAQTQDLYAPAVELVGQQTDRVETIGAIPSSSSCGGAQPSVESQPSVEEPQSGVSKPRPTPLDQLIKQHPEQMLGTRVLNQYGPRLPYLLKIIAADRPLSLQVHPAAHLARAGFNRENREQIPFTAPHRSFHDANHKPEMLVAISEFHALAGLRAPRVVLRMLDGLTGSIFDEICSAIVAQPNHQGLRAALTGLFSHHHDDAASSWQTQLADAIAQLRNRIIPGEPYLLAYQTAIDLANQFLGDAGAIASLLLNRVTLQPGEALFIGEGEVHAYISGLAIEVMANSDNVLRAGLTSKYVNVPALLECMSFHPKLPVTPEPSITGPATDPAASSQGDRTSEVHTYLPPVEEFALTMLELGGDSLTLQPGGPRTAIVLSGEITLAGRSEIIQLRQGDTLFIPDAAGPATFTGQGQLACAWVP